MKNSGNSLFHQVKNNESIMQAMEVGRSWGGRACDKAAKYHGKNEQTEFHVFARSVFAEAHKIIRTEIPAHEKIKCGKGCSHCCHLRVSTSEPELASIISYIFANWTKKKIAGLIEGLKAYQHEDFLDADYWVASGSTCIFLENNVCSIYPARPLTCASMNSIEPEKCKEGHEKREVLSYAMEGNRKFAIDATSYQIDRLFEKNLNTKVHQVELHQSLGFALNDIDVFKTWANGIPVFEQFKVDVNIDE